MSRQQAPTIQMPESIAFYCVTNGAHFLGSVALLNSVRLAGHDDPFYILDCGLEERQRSLLAASATIVGAPSSRLARLAKWAAPLEHPADRMIVLDSDVIVTRPLDELLDEARDGRVVAFADDQPQRFFPSWQEIVLEPIQQRHLYVNSGFFLLPRHPGLALLEHVREAQSRVPLVRRRPDAPPAAEPFHYPDQDTWNAVLNAFVEPSDLVIKEHRLAPFAPFRDVRLRDAATLRCEYSDGVQPFLLHHINQKPWLEVVPPTVYSQVLPRLLLESDVEVRLPLELVPLHLRRGFRARLARTRGRNRASARRLAERVGLIRRSEAPLPDAIRSARDA